MRMAETGANLPRSVARAREARPREDLSLSCVHNVAEHELTSLWTEASPEQSRTLITRVAWCHESERRKQFGAITWVDVPRPDE